MDDGRLTDLMTAALAADGRIRRERTAARRAEERDVADPRARSHTGGDGVAGPGGDGVVSPGDDGAIQEVVTEQALVPYQPAAGREYYRRLAADIVPRILRLLERLRRPVNGSPFAGSQGDDGPSPADRDEIARDFDDYHVWAALADPEGSRHDATREELLVGIAGLQDQLHELLRSEIPRDLRDRYVSGDLMRRSSGLTVLEAMLPLGADWLGTDVGLQSSHPAPVGPRMQYLASELYYVLGSAFGYRDLTERTLRTVTLVSHLALCLKTALELIHAREMTVLALEQRSDTSRAVDITAEDLGIGASIFDLEWDIRRRHDDLQQARTEARMWESRCQEGERRTWAAQEREESALRRAQYYQGCVDEEQVVRKGAEADAATLSVERTRAVEARDAVRKTLRQRDATIQGLVTEKERLERALKEREDTVQHLEAEVGQLRQELQKQADIRAIIDSAIHGRPIVPSSSPPSPQSSRSLLPSAGNPGLAPVPGLAKGPGLATNRQAPSQSHSRYDSLGGGYDDDDDGDDGRPPPPTALRSKTSTPGSRKPARALSPSTSDADETVNDGPRASGSSANSGECAADPGPGKQPGSAAKRPAQAPARSHGEGDDDDPEMISIPSSDDDDDDASTPKSVRGLPTRRASRSASDRSLAQRMQESDDEPSSSDDPPSSPPSLVASGFLPPAPSALVSYGFSAVVPRGVLRGVGLDFLDLLFSLDPTRQASQPPPLKVFKMNQALEASGDLDSGVAVHFPTSARDLTQYSADDLERNPGLMLAIHHRPDSVDTYHLGPQTGRSSTLQWSRPTDLHCPVWYGAKMEPVRGRENASVVQTPFFPNYAVVRSSSALAMVPYHRSEALELLGEFLETRPWDRMWAERSTKLYFLDFASLANDEKTWVCELLEFQYRFRQAIWQMKHYVHVSYDKTLATKPKRQPGRAPASVHIERKWAVFYQGRKAWTTCTKLQLVS